MKKRVTKIIALASIFSFILSYSSLISSLQQRLHLLSMYCNLVDKKYMFLLCNGILGFIVGNFRGNSETLLQDKAINNIVEETKEVEIRGIRSEEMKKAVALPKEKSASKEEVALVVEDDDDGILVQDLAIIRVDDHDHDHDDDEMNDNLLSSEELNKKCEDFIRKMKAGIRLESRKLTLTS